MLARHISWSVVIGWLLLGTVTLANEQHPLAVRGEVVDANQQPVPDACVVLMLRYGREEDRWQVEGKTDADGHFELRVPSEWVEPGAFYHDRTIWAHAEGHAIGTATAYPQLDLGKDEPARVELGVEKPLSIQVFDPGNSPCQGCRVEPHHWKSGNIAPPAILSRVAAVTAGDGTAMLTGLDRTMVRNVVVISDGYGKQRVRLDQRDDGDGRRVTTLSEVGSLEGQLRCDEGESVANISVAVDAYGQSSGWNEGMGEARTDAKGRFRIDHLAEGSYTLFIGELPGSANLPELPKHLAVTANDTTSVEVPIVPSVEVRGQVVAVGSDTPVASAFVSVSHGSTYQHASVLTDAEGRFATRVLPGTVRQSVIVIPKPFREWIRLPDENQAIEVPADSSPFELPPLSLSKGNKISGKLVGRDGKPLPKVRLMANSTAGQSAGSGQTNDVGEFAVTVAEGTKVAGYQVYVPDLGMQPTKVISESPLVLQIADSVGDVEVIASPTPEDKRQPAFPREPAGSATLIVAKETLIFEGRATNWGELAEELERRAGTKGGDLESVHYYRTHGAYDDKLRTEEARNWSKMLTDATGVSMRESGLILNQAAERYDALQFADPWPPGAETPITGRVVDGGGNPVDAAQVVLLLPTPPTSRFQSGQSLYLRDGQIQSPSDHVLTRSDTDGRYRFDFPSARTSVIALAPEGFAVASASTSGDDITLAPWSRITANLRQTQKEGTVSISMLIDARPTGGGAAAMLSTSAGSPTKPLEQFDFIAVPPSQTVNVSRVLWTEEDGSMTGRSKGQPYRLETEPGMTYHLQFGEAVIGRFKQGH